MIEFYVGQKVHCKRNGNGVVTAISDTCKEYPIKKGFITRSAGLPPTRQEPAIGRIRLLNDLKVKHHNSEEIDA